MTDLKSYLAEKYMSGPKAEAILAKVGPQKKKKKRKAATSTPTTGGAIIRDEDAAWGIEEKDEVDEAAEAVVASDRGFKKRRVAPKDEGSGWTTLQEGIKREESPPPAADEQPVVVDNSAQEPFVGGLVAASQLKKVLPTKAEAQTTATAEEIARAQETVYRDATGKKIDTKAARAEAARLKREREEKEAQKMEWGKGLVQREEREKRRLELQKQQGKAFRHADDEDLNEEQKAKELWNDPAAAFLTVSPKQTSKLSLFSDYTNFSSKRDPRALANQNILVLLRRQIVSASSRATDGMALVRRILLPYF